MSEAHPVMDHETQASSISVQPAPGAVFLRLSRGKGAKARRQMFVEMTPGEALALRRELDACISVAVTSA
jgi:hypothetical protein